MKILTALLIMVGLVGCSRQDTSDTSAQPVASTNITSILTETHEVIVVNEDANLSEPVIKPPDMTLVDDRPKD
jgi:hypothetical protein